MFGFQRQDKPSVGQTASCSVIILPVDKGWAVVVMNTNDYTGKVNNLLHDDKTYNIPDKEETQHRSP